jgi:probable HAF family extracellular repeat protein
MHTRNVMSKAAAIAALLASTIQLAADDKTILIELDRRSSALPAAMSASGAVVAGVINDTLNAFYWMPTTGVIFAGGVAADGVSRDGRTIVGWAKDSRGVDQAAIWVRGTEWRLLGSFSPTAAPCDTALSIATDVSSNGEVVVGYARNGCAITHAYRWTESTGMVDLGSSVDGRPSQATGVSADGMVVVGSQTRADGFVQGARWVGSRQELIPGALGGPGYVGSATAANHDGSIVVGRVCVPSAGPGLAQSAWIWRAQGGTTCLTPPQIRPSPGPVIIVEVAATSDDGQVMGGSQNVAGSADSNAVIWIDGQAAYLKDFLRANGVPNAFEGWPNTGTITGISPDGRVIVGWGAAPLGFRGYMVILGSSRVMPS